MITILQTPKSIAAKIPGLLMSRQVVKELGEPILFDDEDTFFVCDSDTGEVIGFSALSKHGLLKYMYVIPEARGIGVFTSLLNEVEALAKSTGIKQIKAISTNMALPIYQKKAFEITHSFTNYHKIIKQL